jgi:uncharacterized protein with GYD domain
MPAYILLGKYSAEGVKGISSARTQKGTKLIEKLGGKVNEMYATIGEFDLILHAEFPDNTTALKGSVELSKLTGISFVTMPAVPVVEFDKLVAK